MCGLSFVQSANGDQPKLKRQLNKLDPINVGITETSPLAMFFVCLLLPF